MSKNMVENRYYTDVVISSGKLYAVAKKYMTHEVMFYVPLTCFSLGEMKNTVQENYILRLSSVLSLDNLEGGRFKLFDTKQKKYSITTQIKGYISDTFDQRVHWIHENCENAWSFSVEICEADLCDLTFSFDDQTEAVTFQMRWI